MSYVHERRQDQGSPRTIRESNFNDDDGHDNDDDGGDWEDMEERGREEDDDNDYDVVNITAVKLFDMPDNVFIGKEKENNQKKEV